jgi:hypothetical protein
LESPDHSQATAFCSGALPARSPGLGRITGMAAPIVIPGAHCSCNRQSHYSRCACKTTGLTLCDFTRVLNLYTFVPEDLSQCWPLHCWRWCLQVPYHVHNTHVQLDGGDFVRWCRLCDRQ